MSLQLIPEAMIKFVKEKIITAIRALRKRMENYPTKTAGPLTLQFTGPAIQVRSGQSKTVKQTPDY